jgi:hypothetical protein
MPNKVAKSRIKTKAKPGPKEERFKIEGMGWEDAVKKSLQVKKPAKGWPK